MSQYGSQAKRIRLARGDTQEAVARRAGLTVTTYVRIETGRGQPTLDSATKIAQALGVTVDELVNDEEPAAS